MPISKTKVKNAAIAAKAEAQRLEDPRRGRHPDHLHRWPASPRRCGTECPVATPQTCIAHLIRNSLDYAGWEDRKLLAAAIERSIRPRAAKWHRPK